MIPKENDRAEKWRKASVEEVFSHGETLVVDIGTEEEIVLDSKDAKNCVIMRSSTARRAG